MIDGYDTAALLTGIAISFGGAAAIWAWAWWAPIDGRVRRWAAARAVPLTEATRPYVTTRMRAARRWRSAGVGLAWTAPLLWELVHRSAYADLDAWVVPSLALALYLSGAVAAEVVAARRLPPGRAAMDAREVAAYVPSALLRWPPRLAVASVVVAGWAWSIGAVDDSRAHPAALHVVVAAAVLAGVGASRWIPGYIVSRRQPVVAPEMTRADDALRSWSAHSCLGAILAAQMALLGQQAFGLAYQVGTPLRWALLAVAVTSIALAIGTFQVASGPDWRWTVRRDLPSGAGG
ncbi:hypothetical protein [Actinomarinicola tropica]|uniref:Uncharacterized protein n=1 Tax=Actinomarinicola tropica TaxID=2789776 RepID=A0A5Q2RH40_9ACTN|nr:hypothetical protein [Actinomarinicola tropica]QGG96149.1 hypothetical protein GH723_14150 [Actinomarinicola tropica]